MKRLSGNTGGLKANHIKKIERLARRRIPPEFLITFEMTRDISLLSHEVRRQIGLLIDRNGKIIRIIVGDHQGIVIPDIREYRAAPGRLRGLRCVHTHLESSPLTRDDFTDLALLRLDMMAAITMKADGRPDKVYSAHILPNNTRGDFYHSLDPLEPNQLNIGCLELIRALEAEMAHVKAAIAADSGRERTVLIGVFTTPRKIAQDSMIELTDLAKTSGIEVVGTILQQRRKIDPRFLMGRGKMKDLIILAMQKGATLLVFDQELNPSQARSIVEYTELKVIDRTQLILDIFAQRAKSSEGKLQVELAQLRYLLPRLVTKNTELSRLTGGIGGRGPGETKLEINRRRVRNRITRLEKQLTLVRKQHKTQKAKRQKSGLPVISIIGYTNAGKSTLLNTLTHSSVFAENRLFATLDPSSKRLRFPRDKEVIITDTVGFIRNLPKDLMVAFRTTLEELDNADLLLHVIDISNPRFKAQIKVVENLLEELKLNRIPVICVFNKIDKVNKIEISGQLNSLGGIAISAIKKDTLMPLIKEMESVIQNIER